MIDRAKLFAAVRGPVFAGVLKQETVNGINAIIDEWERRKLTDLRWLAYILATARGEVGSNMLPVHERGDRSYFNKYDAGTRLGKALGNTVAGDGYRFRGRGLVQLTGRANYQKMTKLTGVDLVNAPDLALQPAIATKIMFEGMTRGSFTGAKLSDYFTPTVTAWGPARRIINGTDKAVQFSEWAIAFYKGLAIKADADAKQPVVGFAAAGAIVASGGGAVAVQNGVSATMILAWIFGLSIAAVAAFIIGYRIKKGHWPWTSTGAALQEPSPLSLPSSVPSSEQLLVAQSALQLADLQDQPSPQPLELKKPRKRSAKPSPQTQTRRQSSKTSKRSAVKKSSQKRKSGSKL